MPRTTLPRTARAAALIVALAGVFALSSCNIINQLLGLETIPKAPTGFTATNGYYSASVDLSWSAVVSAGSYQLYWSNNSGGPWNDLATTTDTYYRDYVTTPGATYYYAVSALSASGSEESPKSSAQAGMRQSTALTTMNAYIGRPSLTIGYETACHFAVVDGHSYQLYWDDSYSGSGNYTGDIMVLPRVNGYYFLDPNNAYVDAQIDSAYDPPFSFTVHSSSPNPRLDLQIYAYSTGTYGIMLADVTASGSIGETPARSSAADAIR